VTNGLALLAFDPPAQSRENCMIRRIVLVLAANPLGKAALVRSFAPAALHLNKVVKVKGMSFDDSYHPVRLTGRGVLFAHRAVASGFNYATPGPRQSAYIIRTEFEDEEAIARLRRRTEVLGVFADPPIAPCPAPYRGKAPVGNDTAVSKLLGVAALREKTLTGQGVRVAVVDTGIDGNQIKVSGGWSPSPNYQPGTSVPDHWTMVAYDLRIAAPKARILDYAALKSDGVAWGAFLSDALAAFADLLNLLTDKPGPLVVNNSWALYNRAEDAPVGSPENYSANSQHPFNQIVSALVSAGADVFFAAGNCGGDCPDTRCGAGDTGPGASIHGANSHPDVISVSAVTVTQRRLGYSSQGPGGLYDRKPDLAAYSHFRGSGVYPADTGTSASCSVAAGVAAALRQKGAGKKLSPAQMKGLLQRTAHDLEGSGWNYDLGYGVIDAAAALTALHTRTSKSSPRRRSERG
jgi:subtilisin family serine protease